MRFPPSPKFLENDFDSLRGKPAAEVAELVGVAEVRRLGEYVEQFVGEMVGGEGKIDGRGGALRVGGGARV